MINRVAGRTRLAESCERQNDRGAKEAYRPDALFGVGMQAMIRIGRRPAGIRFCRQVVPVAALFFLMLRHVASYCNTASNIPHVVK